MSKRSQLNRRRVPFIAARSRRIAPTFPLILTVLLGLPEPRVSSVLPPSSILTDLCAASRLYAQTPAYVNASTTPKRPANFAQSSQFPQSSRSPQTAANAPQGSAPNQVVFFSIPVAADVAVVRSGPSEDAYSTGTVGKNRYVEAYFRSADGWCAIRPPQGSFSWVNAKFVRRETDSTGRIVAASGKAVPSRVGGATVEESALVQVGLKNGTPIKILDETRLSDGSSWLKIAPPSGEFRWIRANDLIADPALAQLPTKLTFQREFLEGLAQKNNDRADGDDASNLAVSDASVSALIAESTASLSAPSANLPRPAQSAADAASSSVSEESATRFKMELARLNADVFQTLRQNPPSDAELALLASRAETLFDAAPTDGERFVVQSIYDAIKIAERRNRARFDDADAPAPRVFPNSSNSLNSPNSPARPGFTDSPRSTAPDAARFGEFQLEGDAPLLVLPDSDFDPSADARSGAVLLDGSNAARFYGSAPSADFNGRVDVSQFFPSEPARSSNGFAANGAEAPEKRPRLAFAFSNANNPFRSRSTSGKEVRVAPVAPQNGGRAAGVPKLPPLLPPQKQLIVPPPNYRSNPLGQNVRENARLVAAKEASTKSAPRSTAQASSPTATTLQNKENAQELTVDSVRWRAVDKTANVSSTSPVVSAAATLPSDDSKIGRAASVAATATAKTLAPVGATVPQKKKDAASIKSNKFQPISSSKSAAFDATGVLAKLPQAPKGAPQYALTRPVGDRFEIVSYLEAENGVALEPYLGREIGVKGTLGTIQIGEKTQKITTVQTVFEQD